MKSIAELENLAGIAAEQYLKHNVPLNDSITKLAQENALNHEQVNRVVEAANTGVYVKLFNESNNKYIEFPNADSEKIATLMNPPKKAMNIADYQQEPAAIMAEQLPIFPEASDPVASKEAAVLQDFYKLASMQERINNAIIEVETQFEREFDAFTSMVKQAVLRGTSFAEVQSAITSLLPDPFIKVAMRTVYKTLQENSVLKSEGNFEKTGSVNTNHPLIKKAEELMAFKNALLTLSEKMEQNQTAYEQFKQANIATTVGSGAFGSAVKTVMSHPKLFLGTAATGAGLGILGYKKYKTIRDQQMNSPLAAVPENYQRNI